jgi:NitT/TauT family transport system substrate-binding protein
MKLRFAAIGFLTAMVAIVSGAWPVAAQQPLKKVRIAVGTTLLNIGYPWLTVPLALGYWRDEGYDVEVLPVGASMQALQQLVAGNADFSQVNASVVIQANVVNDIPARVVMDNGVIDWSVAVLADSPYKSFADLKGKTIGVFSLATGGIAYMQSALRKAGMDPEHDISMVATGLGAPPVQALRSGEVQGLLYWASALATFQNAGLKLRYLTGSDWRQYPDFTLATLQKTVDADPKMVEAIARGAAKATVFSLANPDCVRRLQWKHWPSTKPTGADEATLAKWDLNNLQAQLNSMTDAFKLNGGKYYGAADPAAYERLQKFMLDAKQITKEIPVEQYMLHITDFYAKINHFDAAAVRAAAEKCSEQ